MRGAEYAARGRSRVVMVNPPLVRDILFCAPEYRRRCYSCTVMCDTPG
jgi:hypothetical protein